MTPLDQAEYLLSRYIDRNTALLVAEDLQKTDRTDLTEWWEEVKYIIKQA